MGVPPGGPLNCTAAIFRTSDGGITWTAATIPESCMGCVTKIFMLDETNGWASFIPEQCNSSNCLWKTVDGGLTWTAVQETGTASCVYKTPAALIYTDLFGQGKASMDGGATFPTMLSSGANGIDFVDDQHGIATVYRGQAWQQTSDGGKTWNQINMNIESWSVYGVKGTSTFYAAPEGPTNGTAYQPQVLRSEDYGATWIQTSTLPFVTTGTLVGIGESDLYIQVCGNCTNLFHGIYHSTDRGVTWDSLGGPATNGDTRFCTVENSCALGNIIYAFDLSGNLFRYSDSNTANAHLAVTIYPDRKQTVKPFTTARVPVNVALPHALRADTLKVQSIDYSLAYNSDLLDIPQSKLNFSYSPPTGWAFNKNSSVGTNFLNMHVDNPSQLPITDSLPLGVINFGTYPGNAKSTLVKLNSLTLHLPTRSLSFCVGYEGDFIVNVVIDQSSVKSLASDLARLSVHPNPSSSKVLHISLTLAREAYTSISLLNILGSEVYSEHSDERFSAGEHDISIPTDRLPAGSYYLRINAGGEILSRKIAIVK